MTASHAHSVTVLMDTTALAQPARPPLPRTWTHWVCVFGPGAIIASLTIGTGELIFSTRGGALFGYHVLFVFAAISLLKWARHLVEPPHDSDRSASVSPDDRSARARGWLPIALLMMATICVPIWISFHSGVLGNLMSWISGTRNQFGGGVDYLWGAGFLTGMLILTSTGGYSVLERLQLFVITALVVCAALSLILYQPSWLQLLFGFAPQPLSFPPWLGERYPEIAGDSVFVETTRYVGVIGGAGFDYLAYTSWLREKRWGILPDRATPEQLNEIAANPRHEVRLWIKAPVVDCTISFALVLAFCAVFVALGATILGPEHQVPNEENMLTLQSRIVTRIHPLLLPLYLAGAMLTMMGTLYGTIEVGCAIADEIVRSFCDEWTIPSARRLRRIVIAWSGTVAISILGWLFLRQSGTADELSVAHEVRAGLSADAITNVAPNPTGSRSRDCC